MESTAFDRDTILTDFLTDYLDENLEKAEQNSFEEYLERNEEERDFANKARKGKEALAYLAKNMDSKSVTA